MRAQYTKVKNKAGPFPVSSRFGSFGRTDDDALTSIHATLALRGSMMNNSSKGEVE